MRIVLLVFLLGDLFFLGAGVGWSAEKCLFLECCFSLVGVLPRMCTSFWGVAFFVVIVGLGNGGDLQRHVWKVAARWAATAALPLAGVGAGASLARMDAKKKKSRGRFLLEGRKRSAIASQN